MVGLPRSIIKKYGVTKKAWQVFRSGSSRSTVRTRTTKRRSRRSYSGDSMARRRTSKRRSGSRSSGMTPMNAVIGGALYGGALAFVPQQYNTKLVRAGVSFLAAYKGSGIIKNAGLIGLGMETASLTNGLAAGFAGATVGSAQSTSSGIAGWQ